MAGNSDKIDRDDLLKKYQELLKRLQDINSEFPETKKFLTERGLSHVSELDVQGQKDLVAHLTRIRDAHLKK